MMARITTLGPRSLRLGMLASVFAAAPCATLQAQLFYVGVRAGAGVPTGAFADTVQSSSDDELLSGAGPGLGYGFDAGVGLGSLLGAYASFDRIAFGCDGECGARGKYTLTGYSAGVRVGIPLFPLIKPWAKAGITLNEMEGRLSGSADGTRVTTKRSPGYELGAGVDVPVLGGFFNLTPQVRRIRQKLEYEVQDSTVPIRGKKPVDYYTFDIGLRLRSPI